MVELLIGEGKLLLCTRDLIHELALVECLLGDNLATEVLDLSRQTFFDGVVLLAHDVSPDRVKFVKDLADAGLGHLAIELITDLQNLAYSLRGDPVIVPSLILTVSLTRSTIFCRSSRLPGLARDRTS